MSSYPRWRPFHFSIKRHEQDDISFLFSSLLFSIQNVPLQTNIRNKVLQTLIEISNTISTSNYFYSDDARSPMILEIYGMKDVCALNCMMVKRDIENMCRWQTIGWLHDVCLIGWWAHRLHMNDAKNVSPWLRRYWTQQGERKRKRERRREQSTSVHATHVYKMIDHVI